ncbi:MAG TPA: hypothetical protein VNN17_10310, partial [Terriglobia bacterium]|nr:hypothetical protein [Terriglobia bacterium]
AEPPVPPAGLQRYLPMVNRWVGALRYAGLLALFGIVYLLLLRPVKKQMLAAFQGVSARLPEGAATAGLPAAPAAGVSLSAGAGMQLESGPAADSQRALQLKQHVVNTVRKEPVGASRVIQGWIASGEESI